jgi:hypothetical protein
VLAKKVVGMGKLPAEPYVLVAQPSVVDPFRSAREAITDRESLRRIRFVQLAPCL